MTHWDGSLNVGIRVGPNAGFNARRCFSSHDSEVDVDKVGR
jgi:hypothetical protein